MSILGLPLRCVADEHARPGLFSFFLAIGAFFVLNDTPSKVGKWLSPEEKRFLVLRHRFAAGGETGVAEKEEFSWKAATEALKVRTSDCVVCQYHTFTNCLSQSFHIYAV